MTLAHRTFVVLIAVALTVSGTGGGTMTALAQSGPFGLSYGDTVSDGVPGPGAGNLEAPGSTDTYTFDGAAGDTVIFDVLDGRNTVFFWKVTTPSGAVLFDSIWADRRHTLAETGTYELVVRGYQPSSSGVYSFRVVLEPSGQDFDIAIGESVSDGIPETGAGNLEAAGSVDLYRFDGFAGQTVVFDAVSASTNHARWRLEAPDGSVLFDGLWVDQQVVLPATGRHTLVVSGIQLDSTGIYEFQLIGTPAQADEFEIVIGDSVSDGVPGPGAGNLEMPGAVDRYAFEGVAGQAVAFDAVSASTNHARWKLESPHGTALFDVLWVDQQVTLPETGRYVLTIAGLHVTSYGAYEFGLAEMLVNEAPVAVDDTVATDHATPVILDVLANDSDPDGDTLTITAVGQPAGGIASTNGSTISYTPDDGFSGVDTFTYTIDDGNGGTAEATVTVSVSEPPVGPDPEARIDILLPCVFVNGYGIVPVVLYGSGDLDVSGIAYSTVHLEGMPLKRLFGHYLAFPGDYDGDGHRDVLFLIKEVRGRIPAGETSATLSGSLRDGTVFTGSDDICLRPRE